MEEQQSDEALYHSYFHGEEEAAVELVDRYGDALVRFIHSYLRDAEEAEDLMIEAFARLFAKKRPIHGQGSFKAYLYKTGRNLALRHQSKHRFPLLDTESNGFEPQSNDLAEAGLDQKERRQQLYAALTKLNPNYRECLYLIYFEDMSYKEAGKVMKKSESQITKLVYRGKQSLKKILEKEGFTYGEF